MTNDDVERYIERQTAIHAVVRDVERHCLENYRRHGAQSMSDGTSGAWINASLEEANEIRRRFTIGNATWVDALMRHVVAVYATESLPQLRWALVKLASRAVEWITDIDRRLLESRRVQVPSPTQQEETMIQSVVVTSGEES